MRHTILALIVIAACQSSPERTGADAGADSGGGATLIGAWFSQITTGADDQTARLVLNGDGSFTFEHGQLNDASSTTKAGCRETTSEGGTYTSTATDLVLTRVGGASATYTGCVASSDNGTGPHSGFLMSATLPYTVTATTLVLMLGAPTTFTRQ